MRKLTLFITTLFLSVGMAWAQNYLPNETGAKTRTNRLVGSISVGSDSYSLPDGTRYSYTDATDEKTFTVWAGETISLGMTQSAGTWMNAFVYIDQDKNGFTAGIDTDGYTPTGDLVSYSFYSNDASSDASGYNSVGNSITDGNRSTLSLPNIVAPTTPGTYRIRFKYDWCNIDPAGEQESYFGNTFTGHGGEIIDATLIVDYPFEFVESGKPTKWYHVALHPVNKYYISVNASGQATATNSLDDTKNSAWGFVGNPIDGFKLVNAAGKELVFGSPATVANENGTVFKVVKSTHGGSGFALQAPNSNQCLNQQGGLVKSWTLDQGCTVLLEEAVVFDGEGTAASPYLIDSADKLAALRDKVNGGEAYEGVCFKLTSTITLTGEWTAIGNGTRNGTGYTGNAFKGVFDGGNNTISGLTITSTTGAKAAIGLFGVVDGGTVKNLNLTDVNINVASSDLAGAAIGMMLNGAIADAITVSGAVVGHDGVGGIIGRLIIDGTIANCINNASVTSSYGGIGGIVGKAYYEDGANTSTFASIENCTNNGTVTAPMYVGGIVGLARANVTGCVNNGEVAGGTQTGGIVGQLMAAGTVSGNENKAKIAGRNHLGGIIGDYSQSSDYTYYNVSIANNTNRGELAATEQCAAIMGCNNIDGFTAMTATGNQSFYFTEGLELFGNPEDMVIDATNKFVVPVAKIGEVEYFTFSEAVAAADADETIVLLSNVECAEKPVFTNGGVVNVDINGHVFVSNEQGRIRNVASADGQVASNNIKFVSGFGWEVYSGGTVEGTNFRVFPTLNEAVAYTPASDRVARIYPYENIKLENDITLRKYSGGTSSTICVDPGYDITLDLNGYTVLQESPTGNPLEACIRGNFTLDDTSDAKTGKWIAGACGVTDTSNSWYGNGGPAFYVLGDGLLTLKGGEVSIARNTSKDSEGEDVVNGSGLVRLDAGTLIVDGATLKCEDTYGVMAWGGNVVVNSGKFEMGENGKYSIFAMKYYAADASVEVNSAIDGYLLVHNTASAVVNVAGVKYVANGTDYVAPSVGEGLVAQGGVVGRPVAKIGETGYLTLQDAFDAVQDGETITLVDDVTISVATAAYNDGTYIDGVRYTGDKSFTVDFNGKTVTDDGCVNDYLIYINNKGEKASEITFTNGTIVSANGCWSTVCVNSSAATQNVELNLNGMNITNSNDAVYSGNPVVRARNLATVNVNNGTTITSNGASYGVAANTDGSTVNINEGATIVQQNSGTTGGNSVFAAVGGKGVINIKGGTITSDRYGVHTMTTGTPVINISGGTITAPVALKSSTNGGNGELATINVTGGTINGTLETYTDNGKIVVSGGTFSEAVAEEYCADGFVPAENANGTFGVERAPVASINGTKYTSLAEAVAAVEDGGTITLIANETFTENNRYNNGGWWDGLGYSGDKSFTIDLANFTISQDGALNDYLMWFKNDGAKANTITLKNGTLDAGTTAYCALATASSNAQKITVNLENIKVINNNNNGSTVKVRGGAELNVKAGTVITGKDSYLGIECIASTANIYDGAEIYMNGTSSYNGCLAGVGGNGTINVYGGEGKGVSGGFIAMTSGGTIKIEGGEWTANTDGSYANSNKSVLVAQSDKQYNAGAGNSIVNVTGGTFKGGYNCYGNAAGDAQINISGGNFNANPTSYVAEGFAALPNLDGEFVVGAAPTATVNNLGMTTVAAGEYSIWDGSFDQNTEDDGDMPLSFVMQFLADQDEEDMANSPYADWYGDFVLTFTGLENGSFTADGCYLAGHYGSFGWVKVPVDGMTIEEGVRYPVMLGVGLGQKYDYICSSVEDFKCALYLTPEILEANPSIQVNLELAVVDNSQGSDAAASALVNNENVYSVTDYTYNAEDFVAPAVAKIGDVEYTSLQDALDAAAAGTGNVTVTILADVDLTGVDWNPVRVSDPGYPVVTVEGNDKTITGLNDMLFHSTWAGGSGLIIKNLTIENSAIVNDKDDTQGTVGVGAFIGYPQASATITLENCHLKNSSVEGGHWTGGLIGMAGGYNGNDGPVFMNLTIKGCSVTGSTITGKGSVGGVIGHGSCDAWTNVVIEETTVSNNTITSTGSSNVKAGAVMGTIGAAGQPTTANGETKTGGMSVSATVAENDVKSNGTVITTIYGRQGSATGMLAVAGGSYDNYPIEEGVAYAAPAAGYKIEQNTDGTYGVVVDPAYGMVAKVGDEYFATLQEAINAAQNDETVVLLNTITLADADMVKTEDYRNVMLNISNKSITLDLNENTINIDYDGGQYLFAAVYVADGAGLTVTGNGKIDIAENGINVAYMFWKRGTTGYLTIENGTFHMDDSADSMVYTNGDEIVTVNGGTFTIDNIDTRPNQFPCIFNAAGQNTANIIVNGGTFNDDVAHQYYPFEVMMPREKALKKSESENLWTVVDAVAYVAEKEGQYINEVGYATLAEAIAATEAGETVTILAGDFTQNLDVQKAITVAGETDAEGNNLVNFAGKLNITADGATVKNINVNNGGSSAGCITAKNVTVDGCQVVGGNGFRYCYTEGTVTFKNSVITGSTYGIHFDGSADGNIVIDNCTITGWTSFAATITKVTMNDTRFNNGNYNYVRFYQGAELTGCSFNEEMNVDFAVDGVEVTVADCTVDGDRTVEDLFEGRDIANSSITVDGVKLARIAKIGDEYYETITAAINAAANGATVEILAGEHSEYVAPWENDTQHNTEKSITLVGAADFATVLTGGMYLGYDDSQCREHNIVVKGIAFQGKGLTVACQQNVTIEDNKFTNITEGGAIAVIGKDINSVVKNNVIENVASAVGIELRNTLTATVEGNTISGTGHNALQITSQVGSTESTATVLNNTMSDWGVNGEGRAMRFEGIVTATVNGNVMHHTAAPEEFVKITNTTTLDASANYWNGVSPMTSGMFTGVEGDPIAVLKNYYTDAEKTNLVEFSAAGSAARIGSAYFETLAAAITAAQANDVITFLTDINENVTVNKSVTIDGAGKQYTGTMTGNAGLTITVQNVNFVNGGFDKSTKSTTGTYTIKNCTFTDQGSYAYALRFKGANKVVVEDCTVKGYQYSFLYVTSGTNTVSVKNVTVEDCPNYAVYFASGVNNATFENLTVKNSNNGFIINNTANRAFTMKDCTMENVTTAINHSNGTNAITCSVLGANDFGTAAVSEYVVYKNAAMVGTTIYGDLNDAFADENAGTVTLLGNIEMNATAVVGAGKEITLDLNGKTASMADASGATACAIKNNGELTITDGSDTKDGKITFASTTPSANNGYASNAISNYGTITIEAGTIENLTVGGACYALDNYAGSTSTINGGKLIAEKTTVRIFNWTDGEAAKATLNVTDGEIISKDGYGINVNSGNTPHVELNISGGVITTDDTDYNLAVYVVNKNSAENFTINVDGGTFNGNFALNGVTSTTMAEGAISVTDGTFEGVICYDEPAYGFITGGTYQTEVEESYCALGYQPVLNGEGTYTVEYTGKVSELTIVDGEFTEFVNEQEVTVGTLTYERTLPLVNVWMPLYVPFAISMSEEFLADYDIAYFNDVHGYDDNDDNEVDRTTLELIKITNPNATLKANYPLVIRAKNEAAMNLVLTLTEATLCKAEEKAVTVNSVSFSYEIKGTYQKHSSLEDNQLVLGMNEDGDAAWGPLASGYSLNPFRLILTIDSRGNDDLPFQAISMRVIGEESEDGSTIIYDVEMDAQQTVDYIYDLQGRRVLEPQKGNLYIINGKKVIF